MGKKLQFRTNSRHIGQLGRELVTDFVTALVELVKNSYDADAGSVQIIIEDANTPNSKIIVADTGFGMTQEEFENRWMTIGTSNKLSSPYTPCGRKKAGKKGIGRFSVERLAERATIYSFTESEDFRVFVNWNLYEEISVTGLKQRIQILRNKKDVSAAKYISNQIEYYLSLKMESGDKIEQDQVQKLVGGAVDDYEVVYTPGFLETLERDVLPLLAKQEKTELKIEDIDNPLEVISDRNKEQAFDVLAGLYRKESREHEKPYTGIVMVLERLRDNWRQKDIDKLQKELRLLVAPEFIEKDPFHIELIADQFKIPETISVNSILDLSFAKITASIFEDGKRSKIEYKDRDGRKQTYIENYTEPLLCGAISFELYFFLRDSVHMSNETYNYRLAVQILDIYCGIKIYRDNFRVKPYGDIGNDWLELDKEKVKDTHGYRVGNNQTIGVVKISDEKNPLLIDATNREGIIENEAYEQLRGFIRKCILVISDIRKESAEQSKTEVQKATEEKENQRKKIPQHREKQERRYEETLGLIRGGASYERVKTAFDRWKRYEEAFQKTTEKTYEKTEEAYKKYIEYQETELSMYKNLATLGILTGNFGHETQDIISRINNTLTFYKEMVPFVENRYFEDITDNVMSDFSRISGYSLMIVEFLRKKKRSPQKNLDLKSVLEEVCKLYKGMLKAFHVNLKGESEPEICFTMRQIDLESIIINMITNAFEQVKNKSDRNIFIRFTQQDEDIYLYFEDSGGGIPKEKREEIFRAFYTSKEDGIGLGLNIVKDIVTSYGGTISIEKSQRLGGAKFIIHFLQKEGN